MLEKFKTAVYDEGCMNWTADKRYNITHIRYTETYLNNLLRHRELVSLNEVYHTLGMSQALEA